MQESGRHLVGDHVMGAARDPVNNNGCLFRSTPEFCGRRVSTSKEAVVYTKWKANE